MRVPVFPAFGLFHIAYPLYLPPAGTSPEATKDNFPRDMQWGQALQLVEDTSMDGERPVPLVVAAGDELEILVKFSADSAVMQFEVIRMADEE